MRGGFHAACWPNEAFSALSGDVTELVIPYGEFPHPQGLQRFDEQAGREVVRAFNRARGKRGFPGRPVYIGHPDVPSMASDYPDRSAYGWIQSMTALQDGLAMRVDWSEDGRALVANRRYAWFSPYWQGRRLGRNPKGRGILMRPSDILSVGLVNNPQIEEARLPNSHEGGTTMKNIVLKLDVAALGTELAAAMQAAGKDVAALANSVSMEEAQLKALLAGRIEGELSSTDLDAVAAAVDVTLDLANAEPAVPEPLRILGTSLQVDADADSSAIVAAANARIEAGDQAAALRQEAETNLTQVTEERDGLKVALANTRKALVCKALDHAIATGRLTPAERETREQALSAEGVDLDAELAKLANAAPKLNTQSKTQGLGKTGSEKSLVEMANAYKEEHQCGWDTAWAAIKRQHPEKF